MEDNQTTFFRPIHMRNFNNSNKTHATTLSEYIWKLKVKKISYSTEWKLISKAIKTYSTTNKLCRLCLEDKYVITFKGALDKYNFDLFISNSIEDLKSNQ